MNRGAWIAVAAFILVALGGFGALCLTTAVQADPVSYTAQEKGFKEISSRRSLTASSTKLGYTIAALEHWKRPSGPLRVGIQVGHWKVDEVPSELEELEADGTGAEGGGVREVDVAYEVAMQAKALLEAEGVRVDLLPATLPVGYVADAFIAIHADSNEDEAVSGRKITSPRRDYSGRSIFLEEFLREEYRNATGIASDPSISRSVSGYYGFNWYEYEHALHPMTPAVIIVLGFLTNPEDRAIIVDHPERAARGIADGTLRFLNLDPGR